MPRSLPSTTYNLGQPVSLNMHGNQQDLLTRLYSKSEPSMLAEPWKLKALNRVYMGFDSPGTEAIKRNLHDSYSWLSH